MIFPGLAPHGLDVPRPSCWELRRQPDGAWELTFPEMPIALVVRGRDALAQAFGAFARYGDDELVIDWEGRQ